MHPRERRAQRGWVLTIGTRGRAGTSPTSFMKPAEPPGRARGRRRCRRGPGPILAGGVVAHPADEGRDAGAFGARQPLDAVAVGADGDHLGAVAGSAQASSRACRLVPVPETRTTRRHAREPRRCAGGAGAGAATRSWPARRPGHRCRTTVTAWTRTSPGGGPTTCIRPGPDRAAGEDGQQSRARRRRPPRRDSRAAPLRSQRSVGRRRWARAAASAATTAGRRPARPSRPGSGRCRAARRAAGRPAAARSARRSARPASGRRPRTRGRAGRSRRRPWRWAAAASTARRRPSSRRRREPQPGDDVGSGAERRRAERPGSATSDTSRKARTIAARWRPPPAGDRARRRPRSRPGRCRPRSRVRPPAAPAAATSPGRAGADGAVCGRRRRARG